MNIIVAPCGCGKTTAAINRIAALASSPHKAQFLIDTHNGNVRLAKNEALTMPYVFFPECVRNSRFPSDELQKDKIVVTTYAQFGVWVKHNPAFADNFEVIICWSILLLNTKAANPFAALEGVPFAVYF